MKTTHTVTGASDEKASHYGVAYYVDFSGGAGSAQLQVKIGGDWLPATESLTASMDAVEATEKHGPSGLAYRWNVTVSSGQIITYLG